MTDPAVIEVRAEVLPDWIDFNGHMRDAYYMLVVSWANDALMDAVGMGPDYLASTGCTFYNLENHVRFLKEAHAGETLVAHQRIVDADAKRVHLLSEVRGEGGDLRALNEAVLMHIRQSRSGVASAPIPPEIRARIEARLKAAESWPRPELRAGAPGLRRRA